MANFATCRDQLLLNLRARIPFICVRTNERARCFELFHAVSRSLDAPIYYHSVAGGRLEPAASRLRQRQNLTLVLTDVQHLDRGTRVARELQALVTSAIDHGGVICVITPDPVWSHLQQLGVALTLDPPDGDETAAIVADFVDQYRGNVTVEWGTDEIRQVGHVLAGFTRLEAENQLLRLVAKGSLLVSDIDVLARARDVLLPNLGELERVPVVADELSIGGLAGLRGWLRTRWPLFGMDLRARGLRPPRGMLLLGVPGCGKTLSARLVAAEWNLALFRLDLSRLHSRSTRPPERSLRAALATVDRLAPCVLWIDDLEKGLAAADPLRTGRIVGEFLDWLRDGTRQVFTVCTANDVDRLPVELVRRGQFDELFFVDLPNEDERREIISLYAGRYLGLQPAEGLLEALVLASDGFACSDLAAACAEIAHLALLDTRAGLADRRWKDVFDNVAPLGRTDPESIARLRAWARPRALPASGRPIRGGSSSGARGRVVIA